MILKIKQIHKRSGLLRFSVGFDQGMPVEFLIQERPEYCSPREWNILFAESVIAALKTWLKINGSSSS